MKTNHTVDRDFQFSSKKLKKILSDLSFPSSKYALDIPCGTGRNIFLLATKFNNVKGIDISKSHLDQIENAKKYYTNAGDITLEDIDLIKGRLPEISNYEFICNVHFYSYSLIQNLLNLMIPSSFLYVETPTCAGGNFINLPSIAEVNYLFKNYELIFFEQKKCKQGNSISFTALVKKLNLNDRN